ncbi:MAG: hypothetical protein ACKO6K_03350 [Chitinophagaceae bacterium]
MTWVLGKALLPTTAARAGLGVRGFMNAAFGLRVDFFLATFFTAFLAFLAAGFFLAAFFLVFLVAMILFLEVNGCSFEPDTNIGQFVSPG